MIHIDRIVIDGPRLSHEQARRFAELLGAELGRVIARADPPPGGGTEAVQVDLTAGGGLEDLAGRAASAVVAHLVARGVL